MAEFKDMLKYYRESMGWSQSELASRLKVSPAAVGNWEQGSRRPKKEQEEAIADLFNVSLDNLRGIDTEKRYVYDYVPGTIEIIDLYSRATPEQREAVLTLLRSFVPEENNN